MRQTVETSTTKTWSIRSSYISLQLKHMSVHIFTSIITSSTLLTVESNLKYYYYCSCFEMKLLQSVGWLVSRPDGWLVGWLVCQWISQWMSQCVCESVSESMSQWVSQLVRREIESMKKYWTNHQGAHKSGQNCSWFLLQWLFQSKKS